MFDCISPSKVSCIAVSQWILIRAMVHCRGSSAVRPRHPARNQALCVCDWIKLIFLAVRTWGEWEGKVEERDTGSTTVNSKASLKKWTLLCVCLMTPGLVRTFSVMYDRTLTMVTNHQIRYQAASEMGVSLVITDGHLIPPWGVMWVCMG